MLTFVYAWNHSTRHSETSCCSLHIYNIPSPFFSLFCCKNRFLVCVNILYSKLIQSIWKTIPNVLVEHKKRSWSSWNCMFSSQLIRLNPAEKTTMIGVTSLHGSVFHTNIEMDICLTWPDSFLFWRGSDFWNVCGWNIEKLYKTSKDVCEQHDGSNFAVHLYVVILTTAAQHWKNKYVVHHLKCFQFSHVETIFTCQCRKNGSL